MTETTPLKVLVVEDEMIIALLLEDMLKEIGHEVVGLAMRLHQALDMAQSEEIDVAILDVNLDGSPSFPVAELLAQRQVPFLFSTGYGSAEIIPPFKERVTLRKPYELKDLRNAIARAVAECLPSSRTPEAGEGAI